MGEVFPVGGVGVMLLGAVASLLGCAMLAHALRPRLGVLSAVAFAGLLWSLVVIALVTLIPVSVSPGVVPAEGRLAACSWDLGGPAPDGFWILQGGQRLLNTVLFVPSGVLLVLAATHWRGGWRLVPWGLAGLAAYSAAVEKTQLELARIDRACDVTDVLDNVSGAALGVAAGVLLALALQPWRHRERAASTGR